MPTRWAKRFVTPDDNGIDIVVVGPAVTNLVKGVAGIIDVGIHRFTSLG
jgi:hypothetical protein